MQTSAGQASWDGFTGAIPARACCGTAARLARPNSSRYQCEGALCDDFPSLTQELCMSQTHDQ